MINIRIVSLSFLGVIAGGLIVLQGIFSSSLGQRSTLFQGSVQLQRLSRFENLKGPFPLPSIRCLRMVVNPGVGHTCLVEELGAVTVSLLEDLIHL